MSSDPTEPKAGEEQGEQQTAQVDQAAAPSGEDDDLKARFRDALKRKQAHTDGGTPKAPTEAKVHEVHSSSTRKRQFRRKSG